MSLDTDYYAHTAQAESNRLEKAKAIARHLHGQSVSADTARHLPAEERKAVVKACELASASDLTWQVVVDLLEQRAVWDRAHPVTPQPEEKPSKPCYARGCERPGVIARGGHASRCVEHDRGVTVPVPDPNCTMNGIRERVERERAELVRAAQERADQQLLAAAARDVA